MRNQILDAINVVLLALERVTPVLALVVAALPQAEVVLGVIKEAVASNQSLEVAGIFLVAKVIEEHLFTPLQAKLSSKG